MISEQASKQNLQFPACREFKFFPWMISHSRITGRICSNFFNGRMQIDHNNLKKSSLNIYTYHSSRWAALHWGTCSDLRPFCSPLEALTFFGVVLEIFVLFQIYPVYPIKSHLRTMNFDDGYHLIPSWKTVSKFPLCDFPTTTVFGSMFSQSKECIQHFSCDDWPFSTAILLVEWIPATV